MAMVKQSSSRYEQKRISMLESEIRAAQKAGISANQIKQVVIETYRVKKHVTKQGNLNRLDVDKSVLPMNADLLLISKGQRNGHQI